MQRDSPTLLDLPSLLRPLGRGTRGLLVAWLVAATTASLPPAHADIFELKDGGRIVGTELERSSSRDYVVQSAAGARITISKSHVQRIVRQTGPLLEYEQRSHAIPDTAPAHRELAEWCRQQGLRKQAEHHLQRILELDPSDEPARLSLGYQRQGDHWMTREEIMQSRGLQYYDGTYRTPQDIAIRKQRQMRKGGETDWFKKIKLWRGWLNSRRDNRAAEAAEQISAIHDPLAAPALVKFLNQERNPEIRNLLIATLAQVDHPLAIGKLVDLSLADPDQEVRLQCLEYLMKFPRPLSLTPYVKALQHKENVIVNRAGEALLEIGDPAAISPLIDALVTTHKFQVGEGSSGEINASLSSSNNGSGGGGMSFGGGGPKIEKRDLKNYNVRRALLKLSGGQDFGFDKKAWRRWHVNRRMQEQINARRDN